MSPIKANVDLVSSTRNASTTNVDSDIIMNGSIYFANSNLLVLIFPSALISNHQPE